MRKKEEKFCFLVLVLVFVIIVVVVEEEKKLERKTVSRFSLLSPFLPFKNNQKTGGAARRSVSPSASSGAGPSTSSSAPSPAAPRRRSRHSDDPLLQGTRLQQVIEWCGGAGFDGCLVFDEAHKAKNLHPEEAEIDGGDGDDGGEGGEGGEGGCGSVRFFMNK